MKIEPQATEPDPFEKADSPSAIMAYVFSRMGKDGLKALFNLTDKQTLLYLIDRKNLERDAAELDAVGLPDVAAIVRDFAPTDGEPVCPFPKADRANWRNWFLNVRSNSRVPFETEEAAEECLLNAEYEQDEDGLWRNRFGKVESRIIPTEGGFRISKRLAQ